MGKGEEKRRDDASRCGAPSIEGRKKREERGEKTCGGEET